MIREALIKKKTEFVGKWTDSILNGYPFESVNFFKTKKNQFSNPVGFTISSNVEKIFNEIINESDLEKIKLPIDEIIRMRAVQNFSPSQAVGFVFSLKKLIHDEFEEMLKDKVILEEFLHLESFIDRIALLTFDSYMESREKVYRIRINEVKSRSFRVPSNPNSN